MSRPQVLPFAKQFFVNPKEVGSLIPSSRRLAEVMLSGIDFGNTNIIVEYGPGTGAFTCALLDRLPLKTLYFGVESNKGFQDHLKARFPTITIIPDYAENIFKYIDQKHAEKADLVISGLPFSLMAWDTIKITLNETYRLLRNEGEFRTFIYNHSFYFPKCKKLITELRNQYKIVKIHQIFKNFPPAKIIVCTK